MNKNYVTTVPLVCLFLLLLFAGSFSNVAFAGPGLWGIHDTLDHAKKVKYSGVRFNGYTRAWFFHRYLDADYSLGDLGGVTYPRNISLGDGYDQPILHMFMEATPYPATRLSSEIAFDNRLLRGGSFNNTVGADGRMAAPWYTLNFTAETFTNFGSFRITAGGGVNWFYLSPFTLWSPNDVNTREDMFERYPWQGPGNDFDRYMAFYQVGDISREYRRGNSATQGVILQASGLPGGLSGSFVAGKASGSAGFQSYQDKKPMNLLATRLEKTIGMHQVAVNYLDQFGYESNFVEYAIYEINNEQYYVDNTKLSQLALTLDANIQLSNRLRLYTELGAGSYLSSAYNEGIKPSAKPGLEHASTYKRNWDELLFAELSISDFPLRFQVYRVGVNFVNFASAVQNTSVEQSSQQQGQNQSQTACYTGLLPMIGQITNNKQGLALFFTKSIDNLKVKAGYALSQELVNLAGDLRNGAARAEKLAPGADSATLVSYTNTITFQHTLNNLARSRFGFWERYIGPYSRTHNSFRRSFEILSITDSLVDYKKSFVSLDLELKYKTIFLHRPIIFVNYSQINSIHDKLNLIPAFSEPNNETFLQLFYNEFTTFYNIQRRITLVGLFGYQSVRANMRTELADADGNLITDEKGKIIFRADGKPMHQIGLGYGIGVDYNFHERASLHVRQRWYSHKDVNFIHDRFNGHEMTFELKMFF